LIDRRSRIEIDFEPVSAEFETELLSTGSSYQMGDSSFYAAIEWYREGDNKSRPQLGDFSKSDQQLLESAGDNAVLAFRNSAQADTNGNYIIIPDSLPDTVFQYVGTGNGSQSVVFSFIGGGEGDYRFAGGDNYYFVGAKNGEYLPLVRLPLPERNEFYTSKLGFKSELIGSMKADISLSRRDQNLLSSLDDSDNEGLLFNFNSTKPFTINGNDSDFRLRFRKKDADYDARSRLNHADFGRDYLTPQFSAFNADEKLIEAGSKTSLSRNLTIQPFFGRLDYKNSFRSDRMGLGTQFGDTGKFNVGVYWSETESKLFDSLRGTGRSTVWKALLQLR
jgi:hypothetical protein